MRQIARLSVLLPGLLGMAMLGSLHAQSPAGDGIAAQPVPVPAAPSSSDPAAMAYRTACAFCHGVEARGGLGPDLARSLLVIGDTDGNQLGPYLKVGRPATGMPAFPDLTAAEVREMASFLKRTLAASRSRPSLDPASIVVGDAARGAAYFNGEGGCHTCHSPTGDLRGVGARYNPMILQGRMINPRAVAPGRDSPARPLPRPKVRVTLANGTQVAGELVSVSDFFVTLQDAQGRRRTIERDNEVPKVEISDPLEAHRQLMLKYTDEIMHDLTAYLVTLK